MLGGVVLGIKSCMGVESGWGYERPQGHQEQLGRKSSLGKNVAAVASVAVPAHAAEGTRVRVESDWRGSNSSGCTESNRSSETNMGSP